MLQGALNAVTRAPRPLNTATEGLRVTLRNSARGVIQYLPCITGGGGTHDFLKWVARRGQ